MADSYIQLAPHSSMTVEQAIGYLYRNQGEFRDVIAIGYNSDGEIVIRSSEMSRAEAAFMILSALDWARGIA